MKKIQDIMTKNVQVVGPDSSLREVAAKMKEIDVGSIPICSGERLEGIVTDRDIVLRTLADKLDPNTARASDVMTSPIVYCFEDNDLEEAARVMEAKQIRRLVVLNQNKRLVGIVSLGDLSLRGGSEDLTYEVLERVSESGHKAA